MSPGTPPPPGGYNDHSDLGYYPLAVKAEYPSLNIAGSFGPNVHYNATRNSPILCPALDLRWRQ